jgi:hypothetical protein
MHGSLALWKLECVLLPGSICNSPRPISESFRFLNPTSPRLPARSLNVAGCRSAAQTNDGLHFDYSLSRWQQREL